MKKIVIIGGGSYNWSFGFMCQFIKSPNWPEYHIVLNDIDENAVNTIMAAADRCRSEFNSELLIEKEMDLEKALCGADFVLITISTGGLETMRYDLEIPEKFGILHTVGDTVGPGGWSRAARNIPVFYGFGEKIKRICPNAWILNMSNPLTVLTRTPHKCFDLKIVGMCPGVETMARTLIGIAGFDTAQSRCDFTVIGVDHGSFFTSLYANGADVLEKLKTLGYYRSDSNIPNLQFNDPLMGYCNSKAIFALWREIGYIPAISDRHTVENYPFFNLHEKDADLPFNLHRTSIAERYENMRKAKERILNYIKGELTLEHAGGGHGHDPVPAVVEALSGKRDFLWTSNAPNDGQVPQAPLGAVLETRCRFDAAGVHPFVSPMPPILRCYTMPHILRQEAVIDIVLNGDFDQFVALVQSDPMCSKLSLGDTREMLKQMLEANADYIANDKLLV